MRAIPASVEEMRIARRRARRIREMKARQRAAAKLGTTPMLMQVVRAALAGCGNPDCPDCNPPRPAFH